MPVTQLTGYEIHVDDEGFLTEFEGIVSASDFIEMTNGAQLLFI